MDEITFNQLVERIENEVWLMGDIEIEKYLASNSIQYLITDSDQIEMLGISLEDNQIGCVVYKSKLYIVNYRNIYHLFSSKRQIVAWHKINTIGMQYGN